MKKLLWVFTLVFSLSMFSNNMPPTLSNFRIEKGQTSKVYFDSSAKITTSSAKGFTISGKKISGITINSGKTTGHYFKVSKPFTFWDNNTIRYNGGSNLKSEDNKLLSDFTLEYIANNLAEPKSSTYRYVSLTGNNKNDGTSESKAWRTIDKAASTVTAGMTVWIKAGNYGNENVVLDKSGTASKPIKFIGYKSKIGDIN
ncbi:MAG: hypothetical protein L3J08_06195, partial [Flavobacteriaceae bacterium]|nr:hypothetical protein [Flavobacteriaceae bacterium]